MEEKELEIREYIKQKNREYMIDLISYSMRNAVIILLSILGISKIYGVQIESLSMLIVTSITTGFLSYLSVSTSVLKLEEKVNKDTLKILETLCMFDIALEKIGDKINYEDILDEAKEEIEKLKEQM